MRNRFDRQLSTLNDELIEMGSMIEKSIETAIKALVNQDVDLARHAIEADEEIDRQERIIEDLCLKLLLQQQPVAKDLRLISSALKMITDMERIGDHASDISEITIALADQPYIKKLEHIQQMAKETMIMLVGSIEAFVDKDLEKANEVIKRDDVVDDLFDKVKKELIQMIHENTNMGEQDKLNALLQQKMSELDERERTINELQDMMNAQNAKVQNLLSSVKDALLGFNSDELTVTEKNGKVYVAMSDKLLFQSGSAKVDKRGKEALAKLAEVLNKQNDIDVYIEGHTDSKPINTAQFKDNWDLSVIRATSVVRILTKDYGVNPLQIQPCGRGEFMPVADNETADGRSKNRRTEIIMAPKLDKLMQMLR